ncbi:hypothetical protein V8F06_006341 [Rhypophila decipiens]
MAGLSTTPVATYGRDPKIAESVREKLLPDFEAGQALLPSPYHTSDEHFFHLNLEQTLFHNEQTKAPQLPTHPSIITHHLLTPGLTNPAAFSTKPLDLKKSNLQNPVVHCCLDFAAAEKELPAICAGEVEVAPSSGLGSNAHTAPAQRKIPQAIFFGGGFTDEEYDKIVAAVKARAPNCHFVKVQKRDVLAAGSFGPNPDTIAKIYRKKMAALAAA